MTHRPPPAVAWVVVAALLLSSCAGRKLEMAAARRSDALGLDSAEREAFTREVEACVGDEPAGTTAVAPATTVSVGASGEAATGETSGLAVVGVLASVVVAGITHRAYRWWRGRPTGDGPVRAQAETSPAVRAEGSAEPVAATRARDPAGGHTLETCLDIVTTRWRKRLSTRDAFSPSRRG